MDVVRRRLIVAGGVALLAHPRWGAAAAEHTVTIDAFAFVPASLTVRKGERVLWTNRDAVPHTVTAPGAFDSGTIAAGATWTLDTRKTGRFDYACTFHPTMKATLVVA